MTLRLGIDIGGTFTDATLVDESTGDVRIAKVQLDASRPVRRLRRGRRADSLGGEGGRRRLALRRARDDGGDERDHRG